MKRPTHNQKALLGLGVVVAIILLFWYLKMHGLMLDLSMVKEYRMTFEHYFRMHSVLVALLYMLIYAGVVALTLPFAVPLSILAGFLFGNILGTGIVAIAATSGATISVIVNRFFFYDYIKATFGHKLTGVNRELKHHGFADIFFVRLTPVIPFFLINIAAALTEVRLRDFFLGTLLGVLPFTFVYVNAGTQLANVSSPKDILSLPTILGVSLIVVAATLPTLIRRLRGGSRVSVGDQ